MLAWIGLHSICFSFLIHILVVAISYAHFFILKEFTDEKTQAQGVQEPKLQIPYQFVASTPNNKQYIHVPNTHLV